MTLHGATGATAATSRVGEHPLAPHRTTLETPAIQVAENAATRPFALEDQRPSSTIQTAANSRVGKPLALPRNHARAGRRA
eukprot:7597596-Alexandrium_andersonii.AAC.1